MAWPTQIITDASLLKHVFEQGADRILESGNFTELYKGVSIDLRSWLETNRVSDADDIVNTTDYEMPAANLAWSRIALGRREQEISDRYYAIYLRLMNGIRPQIVSTSTQTNQASATLAPAITKQGKIHYTDTLARQRNKPYRS